MYKYLLHAHRCLAQMKESNLSVLIIQNLIQRCRVLAPTPTKRLQVTQVCAKIYLQEKMQRGRLSAHLHADDSIDKENHGNEEGHIRQSLDGGNKNSSEFGEINLQPGPHHPGLPQKQCLMLLLAHFPSMLFPSYPARTKYAAILSLRFKAMVIFSSFPF